MLRKLPTQRPAVATRRSGPPPAPPKETDDVPHATVAGTWVGVVGCALTAVIVAGLTDLEPSTMAKNAAIGTAVSLAASVYFDFRQGLRNLIRADLLALVALYFLTYFEFLFPQQAFDEMISLESARLGIIVVQLGFAGMLLGRHLWKPQRRPFQRLLTTEVPPGILVAVFWGCAAVGYLHMLIAVNFDFMEMVKQFMEPRFTQPWSRGKLGDWKALVIELGMFIYLLPPLGGIILARRERYNIVNLVLIAAGLLFTLFYGFTSGTRNVFASYLVTLLIGYAFALPRRRQYEIFVIGGACAAMMVAATPIMLAFRSVGIRAWLKGDYVLPPLEEKKAVFVDYNLYAICKVMDIFPEPQPYLGLEIPYNALIRPIPRAVWAGKPEGLSFTIEQALGVEGLTISTTFIGEAFMSFGYLGVFGIALCFGALTGWWSYLASTQNSELGILIYASGFFAAVISMRSLMVLTTAMLPTIAAMVLGAYIVKNLLAIRARLQSRKELRANQIARGEVRPPRLVK